MAGDGVGAGKVLHYVNGKFDYHQRVYNIHNISSILPKLLYYYLKETFKYKIEEGLAKSTVDSVRLPWLKDFPIVIPTDSEQQQIVDYLDEKTAKIDALIEELEAQLSDLATYKQAVITEAVTGKVDVRDWTPKS